MKYFLLNKNGDIIIMYTVDIDRQFSVTGNESYKFWRMYLDREHYVSSYQVEHYVL